MSVIVQKFGGTSVADITKIKKVANIIKAEYLAGNQIAVVVSAMAGVTNSLITKCIQISNLDSLEALREYDAVIASGEIITAALLALELQRVDIPAKSLQGWQIPLHTDNSHGLAKALNFVSHDLKNIIAEKVIPVITGFQGVTKNNDITTLGKGGSDTTATIIAAYLDAERCDIYTDVDGIYSADPRIVHNAIKINQISIDHLCCLCSSGAKILHPRAAFIAKRYNIPMRILSSFNKTIGTIVENKKITMEQKQIIAITANKNLLKIALHYQENHILNIVKEFANNNIPIEEINFIDQFNSFIITNLSEKNKSLSILKKYTQDKKIKSYTINSDLTIVTIVGYGMQSDVNLVWKIVDILDQNNIKTLSLQVTDLKISILLTDLDTEKAIKILHKEFFYSLK